MKKKNIRKLQMIMCFGLMLIFMSLYKNDIAYAAYPVSINMVDYENENIIVNNNGNTKIYFATENDAGRGSWEVMPADAGLTSEIDFSWVLPTAEQVIVIKGEDGTQRRVTLKERTRKLEVSISYDRIVLLNKSDSIASLLNIMSSAGTGEEPIDFTDLEWRKGENSSWKDPYLLTLAQLEKLQIKGTSLYFRIKAENDTTDGTKGRRVSKEVRLKIAKKASPSAVRIDGGNFTAEIRYGKEYRVTHGGVTSNWVKVTDRSTRNVPLSVILNGTAYGYLADDIFPEMVIEVRNYATTRAAASKISEIHLDEQRKLLGEIKNEEAPKDADSSDKNIYLTYNGTANIAITIPSASTDNPYQYAIVNTEKPFEKISWTNITRSSAVKVLATKATEGSGIIIRQKDIKTGTSDSVILASTCLMDVIKYPAVPVVEKKDYIFVRGVSDDLTFGINLNDSNILPFETKIKSIKLGSKELTFGTTTNVTDPLIPSVSYYINVIISKDILNELPNTYSRVLYIIFENGTVDRNSIKLTIQSPTPATTLMAIAFKGEVVGNTLLRVGTTVRPGNKLVYTNTPTKVEGLHTEDVITGTAFVNETEYSVNVGDYITIYEVNAETNKVVRYKCIQITSLYVR